MSISKSSKVLLRFLKYLQIKIIEIGDLIRLSGNDRFLASDCCQKTKAKAANSKFRLTLFGQRVSVVMSDKGSDTIITLIEKLKECRVPFLTKMLITRLTDPSKGPQNKALNY